MRQQPGDIETETGAAAFPVAFEGQFEGRGVAALGIALEHFANDLSDFGIHTAFGIHTTKDGRDVVHAAIHYYQRVGAFEGGRSAQHFKQHDTEPINVGPGIAAFPFHPLRRNVVGGA